MGSPHAAGQWSDRNTYEPSVPMAIFVIIITAPVVIPILMFNGARRVVRGLIGGN